jgi:hypothetical protein
MKRVGLLPVVLVIAACGAAPPVAVPPVVDIPVPPAVATPKPAPAQPAPPSATSLAAGPAPWVERATRTETTKAVGRCQLTPFTFGSTIAVESRQLDGGRLAIRVVQDDETAKGVEPQPVLLGKGYVVDAPAAPGQALQVAGADGSPVPDDQVKRVQALGMSFVGWPGGIVAAHPPAPGAEVAALEVPVAAIAGVPLHGAQVEGESKAVVRFAGTRHGDAGNELAFDVTLKATESDAGMCHSWTNVADLKGELRLRASSGAMVSLRLEGTTEDTEGVCQDPSGKPGPPPPPHRCNRGKVSVEVKQPRVP